MDPTRILLVSSSASREIVKRLRQFGYSVQVVPSIAQAARVATSRLTDLILIRLRRDEKRRAAQIAAPLRIYPDIPILFLAPRSARTRPDLDAPERDIIPYPLDDSELALILHLALERVRSQNLQSESEERLRALVENSYDALTLIGPDGKIIFYSPSNERITGFRPEERIGQDTLEMVHPDDRENVIAGLGALAQTPGAVSTGQYRIRHKDGSWRWVEGTGKNLLSDPRIRAIVVNVRDITEQKSAEDALRLSEERFRELFHNANDIIYTHDLDGNFTSINRAGERISNYTKDEILRMNIADIIAPEHLARAREMIQRKLEEQGQTVYALEIAGKYGKRIPLEVSTRLVYRDGKPVAVQGIARDMTERAKAEQALRDRETHFRALIENSSDAITLTDARGKVLYYAPSNERLIGYTAEERVGKMGFDLIHPEDRPGVIARIIQLASTPGDLGTLEYRIRRKDGAWRWVESAVRNFLHEPSVQAIITNTRDVTERKHAEARVRESEERYRHAISAADAVSYALDYRTHKYTFIGEDILKLTGYSAEEMTPVLWRTLVQETVMRGAAAELTWKQASELVLVSQLSEWKCDVRIATRAGDSRWLSDSSIQIHDDTGQVIGAIGILQDITERKRAEEELRVRERHLRVLNEIAQVGANTLDFDQMIQLFADRAAEIIRADACYITLWDEATQRTIPVAAYGPLREVYRNLPPNEPRRQTVTYAVMTTGRPLAVEDIANSPYANNRIGAHLKTQSVLGLPLLAGSHKLGAILVGFDAGHHFSQDEIERSEQMASQIALALSNARLFQQTQRRANEFAALYETTRDLSAERELPTLLDIIKNRAIELLGAHDGAVLLFDPERKDLWQVQPQGARLIAEGARIALGEGMAGRVALSREPMIVDDYRHWEHAHPADVGLSVSAIVQVPMLFGGELIGVLSVNEIGDSDRKFTSADARLLSLFAMHAASAVSNTRLIEQTRRRANEFATLYEIASDLSAPRDMPALLELIVSRAQTLLNTPACGIFLYDAARQELERVVSHGLPVVGESVRLKLGEGMAGRVAQLRQPLIVNDYHAWENRAPTYESIPIAGVLQVPMLFAGELVGVLSVGEFDRERQFTPEDTRLLSLFATQAASAVYNTRLIAQAQRRAEEFAALYESSSELSKSQDVRTILQTIVERATRLLGASHGTLYTFDSRLQELVLQAAKNFAPPKVTQKIGEGLLGRVAQSRQTMVIDDYRVWSERMPEYDGVPLRASLQVPMLYAGDLLGILGVGEHGDSARKFTRNDADLLELFAAQAASAVHNARLFQETRRRVVELDAINRISTALRAAETLDEMLPALLEQMLAVIGTNTGSIRLWDPEHKIFGWSRRGWMAETPEPPSEPTTGIAGYVFRSGRVYRSREFCVDPQTRDSLRDQVPPGWGGVCVPVRAGAEIVGIMFVSVQLPRELDEDETHLLTTLAEIAGNAIERTRLDQSLEETYLQTIRALASTVDARDSYTGLHSDRLARLGVALARELNLSKEEQEILRFAAYLHDIGKIGIPDAVLRKPGPLDTDEWRLVKQHPVIGAQILEPLKHLKSVVPIVRYHQERFDGTGYPEGLKGDAIPLPARILSVVDAYSAMVDDRVYHKGRSHDQAVQELVQNSGTQFDPRVVEAFLHLHFADSIGK